MLQGGACSGDYGGVSSKLTDIPTDNSIYCIVYISTKVGLYVVCSSHTE